MTLLISLAVVGIPAAILMAVMEVRYRRDMRRITREGAERLARLNNEAQRSLSIVLAAREEVRAAAEQARSAYAECIALKRKEAE